MVIAGNRVLSFPIPSETVLPDRFHHAQINCQNARKKAPALNVNSFIAFLDVSEGGQKSIFKNISGKCHKI